MERAGIVLIGSKKPGSTSTLINAAFINTKYEHDRGIHLAFRTDTVLVIRVLFLMQYTYLPVTSGYCCRYIRVYKPLSPHVQDRESVTLYVP